MLAAHIWWQEAGRAWNRTGAQGTFLGVHNEIAYALLYNGILHDRSVNGGNVLTRQTLAVIQEDLDLRRTSGRGTPYLFRASAVRREQSRLLPGCEPGLFARVCVRLFRNEEERICWVGRVSG